MKRGDKSKFKLSNSSPTIKRLTILFYNTKALTETKCVK